MTHETALILLPDHTREKLQKLVVDRIDDLNEAVILEPARKDKA